MRKPQIGSVLKKSKNNIAFIILLFTISLLYNYPQILKHRPYSIHQWRQADCLSLTLNYYKEGRNFFEPAIHWVGNGKDGKTISEFPIIYYTVAKLWKLFGYHEYIFRLVNILIVFSGLFCLYRLIFDILSDLFWSITITLFLFTSPILVYYTNNFTADAPAFGLALIGCYFIWNGYKKQNKFWYYSSFLFFLLAGLIKISSLLSFIAILCIHIFKVLYYKKEKWWFYKWYNILPYFIVLGIIAAWYKYAVYYNEKNLGGIFLTGIFPIWDLDATAIKNNWLSLRKDLMPAYFNKVALTVNFIFFVILHFFYKNTNRLLFFMMDLVFLGMVAYCILFYQAFTVHDYYLTNLLIFLPLPVVTMLEMLKRNNVKLFQLKFLKFIAISALLILIYETSVINRLKYSATDDMVKNNIAVGKMDMDYWSWYHWDYKNHLKAYETIIPYLRKIGLKRTDRVLCLPDASINISLYLMDQKGFTAYGYSNLSLDQRMKLYKKNGVQYLITDTLYFNENQYLKPYIHSKIGSYDNINVFKLN